MDITRKARKELTDEMIGKLWQLGCFQENLDKIIRWFREKYKFTFRRAKAETTAYFSCFQGSYFVLFDPRVYMIREEKTPIRFKIFISRGRSHTKSVVYITTEDDWRVALIERLLDYFRCVDGIVKGPKESYAGAWTQKEWT